MSIELISILVLVVIFVIATTLPINMGALAFGFAAQYNISAFLMGLMVIHGAQAGGFSPISVYGVIVNGVVSDSGLPQGEITLFLSSLIFNLLIGIVMFVLFGGLALLRSGRVSTTEAGEQAAAQRQTSTANDSSESEAEKAQGDREPDDVADTSLRR